ncbi:PEP-utilizing enzyme [Rhodococcus koreensis]|uniref:PEP-utilizing enzyme n=1 Tax=Rhodococcus koreensis TaxID=99653 RepID=UPI0036714E83
MTQNTLKSIERLLQIRWLAAPGCDDIGGVTAGVSWKDRPGSLTTREVLRECCRGGRAVIDIGGSASHDAVVARELGLPFLIGTENGTRAIREGGLDYE